MATQSAEYLRHLEAGEPEPKTFKEKLKRAWNRDNFPCVGLDSDWELIPTEYKTLGKEEGTFQFNKEIIDSTADLVCAFKPNIAFYEDSIEGEKALERTVAYIHEKYPYLAVIGDVKRADIDNTNGGYVREAFERYKFDAVTVSPYLGGQALKPFLDNSEKGIIVLCRTSNQGAGEFQDAPVPIEWLSSGNREEMIRLFKLTGKTEVPFYMAVAYKVSKFWDKNENCAVVVGATYPEELEEVRKLNPTMPILIPGVGKQGGDVQKTVVAGMDKDTQGMIINSSRAIIFADREEGETVGEAARRETIKLRETINYYRKNPEAMTDSQRELADYLLDYGAIKFGAFKLKLHEKNPSAPLSPIYIEIRKYRSFPPEAKAQTCKVYLDLMKDLSFARLADIPLAISPLVADLSSLTGIPMITPRVEKKGHGSGAQIEGEYKKGQRVVVADDLITGADSKFEAIDVLEKGGLVVKDVVVLVDREQGGREQLEKRGYKLHSAFTLSNLLRHYLKTGRIDKERYNQITGYLSSSRKK